MKYKVKHRTSYEYSQAVSVCYNKAHLTPRDRSTQYCYNCSFQITPEPASLTSRIDYFGNRTTYFVIQRRHQTLEVVVESEVSISPSYPPPEMETPPWETVRDHFLTDLTPAVLEASEYCFDSRHIRRSSELADYAISSFPKGRPILDAVKDLTARIYNDFEYQPRTTTISTTLPEVMRLRKGVCQDFAHLQIGCLRSLGLSARYVSGYLRTLPPPGQNRLIGADASHAWLSIYIPGFDWIDLDPTNNSIPSESHVTLGWGRDYNDVSPVRGVVVGGGTQKMTVSVDVLVPSEVAQ